jgi:hypothetical protein
MLSLTLGINKRTLLTLICMVNNIKHKRFCYKCLDRNWLIECKCGCKEILMRFNKSNQQRSYLNGGHISRTKRYNSRAKLCKNCYGKNFIVQCKCGCKLTKPLYNNSYEEGYYIKNHNVRGKNHHMYNGYTIIHHGYRYTKAPQHRSADRHGYVLEHRLVWELFNKACLLPWADVHHIDHNTLNNDISNLKAMTNSQHTILHNKLNMNRRFCLFCHSNKTGIRVTGRPQWMSYNNGNICSYCYNKILRLRKKII